MFQRHQQRSTSYALLNLPLTILKPIVGVLASIVTGISVHLFRKRGKKTVKSTPVSAETNIEAIAEPVLSGCSYEHSHGIQAAEHESRVDTENITCGCGKNCQTKEHAHQSCDSCGFIYTGNPNKRKEEHFQHVLYYGFLDMLVEIALTLFLGFIIAAALSTFIGFIPEKVVTLFAGNPVLSFFVMLLIGLPVYVCSPLL